MMNSKTFKTMFAAFVLGFGMTTLSTSALAGASRDGGAATSKASESASKSTKRGSYKNGKTQSESKVVTRSHDVRVVKSTVTGKDGQGTYFLTVDGDLYKLVLDGDKDGVIIELFDRSRDLIVGYTADRNRVMVLDPKGIVEDSRANHTDLSSVSEYGAAAQLLTDPGFIQQMVRSAGVDIGSDDDPSAYWYLVAYLIVRCVDITISGDFEGNFEWSVVIDC